MARNCLGKDQQAKVSAKTTFWESLSPSFSLSALVGYCKDTEGLNGGVFLLSQAMLTVMLLTCVLLLALPPTLGVQMAVAPLEGIRRPDQALFPEFPGEYVRLGVCGLRTIAGHTSACLGPSPCSQTPIPTLGGGYCSGAWRAWPLHPLP